MSPLLSSTALPLLSVSNFYNTTNHCLHLCHNLRILPINNRCRGEVVLQTCASDCHVQLVLVCAMVIPHRKPCEQLLQLCQYQPRISHNQLCAHMRVCISKCTYSGSFFYLTDFFTGTWIDDRKGFSFDCFVPLIVDEDLCVFDIKFWWLRIDGWHLKDERSEKGRVCTK